MELDSIDRRILSVLLEDGRASVETVAQRVNLSPTPVRRRIKRLESEGVICGYSARLNLAACGLGLTLYAFVTVKSLDRDLIATFERSVRAMPEVQRCHLVTGSYAYVMVLQLANIEDYNRYLRQRISKLAGVASITTQVSIDTVKDRMELPP